MSLGCFTLPNNFVDSFLFQAIFAHKKELHAQNLIFHESIIPAVFDSRIVPESFPEQNEPEDVLVVSSGGFEVYAC